MGGEPVPQEALWGGSLCRMGGEPVPQEALSPAQHSHMGPADPHPVLLPAGCAHLRPSYLLHGVPPPPPPPYLLQCGPGLRVPRQQCADQAAQPFTKGVGDGREVAAHNLVDQREQAVSGKGVPATTAAAAARSKRSFLAQSPR